MATTLLHVRKAFTPTTEIDGAGILMRDGVIDAIGQRADMSLPAGAQEVQTSGRFAAPGFVDVHIHGAGGRDVMEGTAEALSTVCKMLASHGTTSYVATTITAKTEEICRSAEGI
jgi:N-acetylglucosamine-6-phosphate deacetylase